MRNFFKVILHYYAILTFVCLLSLVISKPADAGDWRFPFGLTYVSGYNDVVDLYEKNLEAEGYSVDSFSIPVGISFHPYYEFDSGFRIGTGFGPMSYMMASVVGGNRDDVTYFDFPINGTVGFTFKPKSSVSPFVRGGVMYHLASGTFVESSSPGLFGGAGIEFMTDRAVALGIEVSYDTSEIEFENNYKFTRTGKEDIQPYKMMISIFAVF